MVNIHPESKAARVLNLYSKIDDAVQKNNTGSNCKKGCSDCCYTDFPFSDIEMDLITVEMSSWNETKLNNAMKRAREIFNKISAKYPDFVENYCKDATGNLEIMLKDMQSNPNQQDFKCPFLDDNNACEIYNVRPVICRTYGTAVFGGMKNFRCKKASDNQVDIRHLNDEIESLRLVGNIALRPYPMIIYFYRRFLNNGDQLVVTKDFGYKLTMPEPDYIRYLTNKSLGI